MSLRQRVIILLLSLLIIMVSISFVSAEDADSLSADDLLVDSEYIVDIPGNNELPAVNDNSYENSYSPSLDLYGPSYEDIDNNLSQNSDDKKHLDFNNNALILNESDNILDLDENNLNSNKIIEDNSLGLNKVLDLNDNNLSSDNLKKQNSDAGSNQNLSLSVDKDNLSNNGNKPADDNDLYANNVIVPYTISNTNDKRVLKVEYSHVYYVSSDGSGSGSSVGDSISFDKLTDIDNSHIYLLDGNYKITSIKGTNICFEAINPGKVNFTEVLTFKDKGSFVLDGVIINGMVASYSNITLFNVSSGNSPLRFNFDVNLEVKDSNLQSNILSRYNLVVNIHDSDLKNVSLYSGNNAKIYINDTVLGNMSNIDCEPNSFAVLENVNFTKGATGIILKDFSNITMKDVSFEKGSSGVLTSGYNNITVEDSEFNSNYAFKLASSTYLYVNNSLFANNGTAISARNHNDIRIDNSNFTNNSASFAGSAIFIGSEFNAKLVPKGGSLVLVDDENKSDTISSSSLKISNCEFYNGSSFYGGSIAIFYTYNVSIDNSHFKDNSAIYGGSLLIFNNSDVVISNSSFTNSTAELYAGAIYEDGHLTLLNTTFENNYAYLDGKDILSSSKINGNSKFNSTTLEDNMDMISKTELTKINDLDNFFYYSISNFTEGYLGFCAELLLPSVDNNSTLVKMNSSILRNKLTDEDVSQYLKILLYKHFPINGVMDEDSLYYTSLQDIIWIFTDYNFRDIDYVNMTFGSLQAQVVSEILENYNNGLRIQDYGSRKVLENETIVIYDFKGLFASSSQNQILIKTTLINNLTYSLDITKVSLNNTVNLTNKTSFRIIIKNNGKEPLENVTLSDKDYSDGLVFDSWTNEAGNWTYNYDNTWTLNNPLAVNETVSIIVTFNTTSKGLKINTAVANSSKVSNTYASNISNVILYNFTVVGNLNETVNMGNYTKFNITITNTGNGNLTYVSVGEVLYDYIGLEYIDYCNIKGNWTKVGETFILNEVLEPGQSATVMLLFRTLDVGLYKGSARVTSNQTGDTSENRSLSINVVNYNLEILKEASKSNVYLNDTIEFNITLKNTGKSNITNITVDDTHFSNGLIYLYSILPENVSEIQKGIFLIDSLDTNQTITLTLIFNTSSLGTKSNTVFVATDKLNNTLNYTISIKVNSPIINTTNTTKNITNSTNNSTTPATSHKNQTSNPTYPEKPAILDNTKFQVSTPTGNPIILLLLLSILILFGIYTRKS